MAGNKDGSAQTVSLKPIAQNIAIMAVKKKFEIKEHVIAGAVILVVTFLGIIASAIGVGHETERQNTSYISATYSLGSEVQAYRMDVEAAAERYGSLEYVNLFLAVMMQESGGRAVDVFQCAESMGYGPQGISGTAITTEESIDHGVALLSNLLKKAEADSPTDIERISLALQSYNMGSGFMTYAKNNYGGFSVEAAYAFQKEMSHGRERTSNVEILGPYSYGDANYAAHVLRYYSYGTASNSSSGIPRYYQDDYADVPFGPYTIATSGCGITSFAMVATYISGTTITPKDAVEWCGNRYYTDAGLSWAYFQAATTHFNLGVSVTQTYDPNTVIEALKQGKPVICSQAPGLFTVSGHLIVLSGIDEQGRVYVNDPYKRNAVNKGYNDRAFDFLNEIHITSKSYWIFG